MEKIKKENARKISTNSKIIIVCIVIIMIAIIIIFSLYISERPFKNWMDTNIFRKNISTADIARIDLQTEKNNQIYCYNKNICILNEKNLNIYNSQGNKTSEIAVDINNALFASSDKYLAIAENHGQKVYVISNEEYLCEDKVEGEILQIYINKNGYLAVVSKDTTYKSIITLYNQEGKMLFKNYLSTTRIEDLAISNDNKYIAFAEIDTSGALIQSRIKTIAVEDAIKSVNDVIKNLYDSELSKMIIDIEYTEKNQLIAMYDDEVIKIDDDGITKVINIDNSYSFLSINLKNSIAYIQEESTGIFNSKSVLNILNISNNKEHFFSFDEVAKEMYTYENIIGINIGTEIYFVEINGILKRKYTSNQEITNVIMSNDIAIIVCKDKIEIIEL